MANIKNLIPQSHVLTVDEASRGGVNSGKSRRERKTLARAIDDYLQSDHVDEDGETRTGVEIVARAVIKAAIGGNVKAFELIRDTVGEKPVTTVQTTVISPEIRKEVEELVEKYECG